MNQPEQGIAASPNAPASAVGGGVSAPPRPAKAALPLLLALWLGVLAHLLTNGSGWQFGLNLTVWVVTFAGVNIWTLRRQGQAISRTGLTLLSLAALFALTFTLYAVPGTLGFLNSMAMLLCLLLGAALLRFPAAPYLSVTDLLGTAFSGWLRLAYGPLVLLERFPWGKYRLKRESQAGRWGVGTLLTLPVLVVFTGLLASADQGFSQLVSSLLHWRLDDLWSGGFNLIFWTALAGGLTYPALLALRPSLFPDRVNGLPKLGLIETGLPLAALAALFIVFLLTQLPYYLSGSALPDGLTFATYIRKGFGELMTVAFLTLALLLGAHALTREDIRTQLPYRLLNLAVLAPLALVILSAANRWRLYTLAYGLSDIRVTGAAFLVWVTLALTWLALLLWRGDLKRFAYPALLAGFGTLLVTTALNPAALIARVNIGRQTAGITNELRREPQTVSAWELLSLGAGAVPVIVQNLDEVARHLPMPCQAKGSVSCPTPRQALIDELHDRYDQPCDPRAWNAASARAFGLVQQLPPRSTYHLDRGYSD